MAGANGDNEYYLLHNHRRNLAEVEPSRGRGEKEDEVEQAEKRWSVDMSIYYGWDRECKKVLVSILC